ncbi:hypothetical protein GGR51DRAFT_558890 [Nemania sp. FL0031]|nr:hypothetical protein GGR51DRAFT_558890 [Nemania sp. FL0031]
MPIIPGAYWDVLERHTPPVKRRATHAKARTGCLTCKKRRVKCDEARPTCARCVKAGHRCAGYQSWADLQPSSSRASNSSDSGSSKHPEKAAPAHPLLRPKPPPAGRGSGAERRVVSLVRASLTPNYLDARDALYFERFKCQILADMGAWCGSEYWRHTIVREVLLNKMIQHAALGSAATLMDIEEQQHECAQWQQESNRGGKGRRTVTTRIEAEKGRSTTGKNSPVRPLSNINAHGKAALHHYTAAISLCRQSLAAEGVTSQTARPSLTATFFFAIFELVQGNISEADRIIANGISLLDDALSRTTPDGLPALVPDNELREIQLGFERMRVTWGLCPYFGGSSDMPAKVATKSTGSPRHFVLPSLDAPVRTKQIFWNAFSSDFSQFMVSVQGYGHSVEAYQGENLSALLARRTYYLAQLHHWLPVLEDLCARDPESAILCTTRAYAQTAIIFLNCFLDETDLAYDAYLSLFKDIVATYQRLLPSEVEQGYLRLTLDVDLFYIITFTVSKCRDRETRETALKVFGEMTRRQALWTNSGMLAALRALAALEDEDRDPYGFVPASARYHYVHSEWDIRQRQNIAVFVPVLPQSGGISTIRIPIRF